MVNARSKGANGEREAADWLQQNLKLEFKPERNLEQVRSGGYDLNGLEPLCFEIKRCEAIAKRAWWVQAKTATVPGQYPVVMYRKNRQPWRFLISANLIGNERGYLQLEAQEFIEWARKTLIHMTN